MNRHFKHLALAIALAGPLTAAADDNFARVKKDVGVMSQILKGAFKSERGHRHGVAVEGGYLADQGAVFTIRSHGVFGNFALHVDSEGSDGDNVYFRGGDAGIPPIPPPGAGTLDGMAGIDVRDLPSAAAMAALDALGYTTSDGPLLDRDTRAAIRDNARQIRDLDQQISDNRIEMLHADKDEDRKKLETKAADLEKRREAANARREELGKKLEAAQAKLLQKQKQMREKIRQERQHQLESVERVTMESLCEYGSTLKNLPANEHVSVIIDDGPGNEDHHVYVMKKNDVTECKSGADGLLKAATRYSY